MSPCVCVCLWKEGSREGSRGMCTGHKHIRVCCVRNVHSCALYAYALLSWCCQVKCLLDAQCHHEVQAAVVAQFLPASSNMQSHAIAFLKVRLTKAITRPSRVVNAQCCCSMCMRHCVLDYAAEVKASTGVNSEHVFFCASAIKGIMHQRV
jgi:hypothetical protein